MVRLILFMSLQFGVAFAQTNCPANLPYYPPLARQARIEGVVKVEFDIASDGNVTKALVKSGHLLLQSGAINFVKALKFETASDTRHETIEFHYKIKGKEGVKHCTQVRIDLPIIEITQAPPLIMYENGY
jgi:TonB family protein